VHRDTNWSLWLITFTALSTYRLFIRICKRRETLQSTISCSILFLAITAFLAALPTMGHFVNYKPVFCSKASLLSIAYSNHCIFSQGFSAYECGFNLFGLARLEALNGYVYVARGRETWQQRSRNFGNGFHGNDNLRRVDGRQITRQVIQRELSVKFQQTFHNSIGIGHRYTFTGPFFPFQRLLTLNLSSV
jgi:hypothetical protein